VLTLPAATNNLAGNRLVLEGDEEPFDNQVFLAPTQKTQRTILYIGADSEADPTGPLFFLKRALQDTGHQTIRIITWDHSTRIPAGLDTATLIVCTGAALGAQAEYLRTAITHGKTLLFAPTDRENMAGLGPLLGIPRFDAREQQSENFAMLGQIEFKHPLFLPFADSRYSDFTRIHFWKHRQLDREAFPSAQVLARFDSGDPAILQLPNGKGQVFVFASCWHPADSQLALSSKFVPLLYSLLELSGAPAAAPAQYLVGESVSLPASAAPIRIQLPDNTVQPLAPGETNFTQTLIPGVYSVLTAEAPLNFAVNLDPSESRTAPLAADELERLGVPMAKVSVLNPASANQKVQMKNAELEGRQRLWRWIIIATLLILAVETWLAGWTARRAQPQEERV
jgi:hypothetical protein